MQMIPVYYSLILVHMRFKQNLQLQLIIKTNDHEKRFVLKPKRTKITKFDSDYQKMHFYKFFIRINIYKKK